MIQLGVGIVLFFTLLAVVRYAWETRKLAKATNRLAEATAQPILVPRDIKKDPLGLEIKVANSGNGQAMNVSLNLMHSGFESGSPLRVPILDKGEQHLATFRYKSEGSGTTSSQSKDSGEFTAFYQDIAGNWFKTRMQVNQDLTAGTVELAVRCDKHSIYRE